MATRSSSSPPAPPVPDPQYADRATRRRHEALAGQIAEATRQRDALTAEIQILERGRDLLVQAGASALAELTESRRVMATVGRALAEARQAVATARAEEAAVRERITALERRAAEAQHQLEAREAALAALAARHEDDAPEVGATTEETTP